MVKNNQIFDIFDKSRISFDEIRPIVDIIRIRIQNLCPSSIPFVATITSGRKI